MLSGSKGESRISTFIYIAVAVIAIYAAIKTVPPYMHYYTMEDEVTQQIKLSKINPAETIREDLIAKAEELGIPLAPENIDITYDESRAATIYMYWQEEVDYGYGIIRTYEFEINSTGSGILEE